MRVAARLSGTLAALAVARGSAVANDAPLFTLENEQERAGRAEVEARVRQAQATLANLEKARRGRRRSRRRERNSHMWRYRQTLD